MARRRAIPPGNELDVEDTIARLGRWFGANAEFLIGTLALAAACDAGSALAGSVVSHFVPLDRSYGTFADEGVIDETLQLAVSWVTGTVASIVAWLFVRGRTASPPPRANVTVVAILVVPVAFALLVLGVFMVAPLARFAIFFGCCDLLALAGVSVFDRLGARALRILRTAIVAVGATATVTTVAAIYDIGSPDAAARARDRLKISMIRYAGTHYARYPNSPWSAKPRETTDAEMNPLGLTYRQIDRDRYRICTTFETAVSTDPRFPHGAGSACYTMTFDDAY